MNNDFVFENENEDEEGITGIVDCKINQVKRTIKNKGLNIINDHSNYQSRATLYADGFIDINESEVKNLPIKLKEKDTLGYYTGVVRAGLTNLNYLMNDKGLMKIMGVRPLKLTEKDSTVHLFGK